MPLGVAGVFLYTILKYAYIRNSIDRLVSLSIKLDFGVSLGNLKISFSLILGYIRYKVDSILAVIK